MSKAGGLKSAGLISAARSSSSTARGDFSLHESGTRIKKVSFKGIRVERQCPLELGVRFIEFTGRGQCDSACGMRFGEVTFQRQRLRCCIENSSEWNIDLVDHVEECIAVSDARVSARNVRVELNPLRYQ